MQLARERLLFIFSKSEYFFEDADYFFEGASSVKNLKFPDLLVDMSNYVDPRLFQGSLYLLHRYSHAQAVNRMWICVALVSKLLLTRVQVLLQPDDSL